MQRQIFHQISMFTYHNYTMQPSHANFCHPFEPYDIQVQFMRNLYTCIEHGNVGIFESPTGTGKSLSLICGALTWLRDDARRQVDQLYNNSEEDTSDWLTVAENKNRRTEFLREREELERTLASLKAVDESRKRAQRDARPTKKAKHGGEGLIHQSAKEEDFMLDDYDDQVTGHSGANLSTSTQALLNQLKPVPRDEDPIQDDRTKIIFCSRTHSQLTQFIHELQRVTPPSSLPVPTDENSHPAVVDSLKHLPLGSRKNLCINPQVYKLKSTTLINDRCVELQRPGTAKDQKCQFLPTKESKQLADAFRNRAVASIHDIEDIASLGRDMKVCPYYTSRNAIPMSEIITMPYPLLLQSTAREALGVQVKGNVVIIDEAHNLMDAIADTCSVSLALAHIDLAAKQVTMYAQRFKNRLKGSNRMYIAQVLRLLNSLASCLRIALDNKRQDEIAVTAAQLLSGKGVDQIQPNKLLEYLQQSRLAHKVDGYIEFQQGEMPSNQPRGTLMRIQSFFAVLTHPASEGRFFISKQNEDVIVRYTLLDPRQHFRDIVQDARAVILAGGTMSPMKDYADYLFSYVSVDRLKTFSFGHVIPAQNLLVESISKSPRGIEFEFTFGKRNSAEMISELGCVVLQACRKVPDGVVVFFPSYDYLAQIVSVWKRDGSHRCLFSDIESAKPVFEESKEVSVDALLTEYTSSINAGRGGLMLSVVGGKLSEGINFSDKLGRAVIAVGLPFPNVNSAEWKAKMEHIEKTHFTQCQVAGMTEDQCRSQARSASQDFYENACMRAVNQCIGRAIRHQNDYAAILLIDRRFSNIRIRSKLPQWILSSARPFDVSPSWMDVEHRLTDFFQNKSN